MATLEAFTNLYQLSKTLRFELIPEEKTREYIEKNGLLTQDEHRAESYKKVKKIIDEYHKKFIDDSLKKCSLKIQNEDKNDSLEDFRFYYKLPQQDELRKKNLPKVQENLRKQVVTAFTSDTKFTRLDKKELIKEDLLNFTENDENKKLINEFKDFTTYFTGFHENRKNMYSAEEKSTAIAFRLIHENLPRFIDNMTVFDKVKASPVSKDFTELQKELESIIQVLTVEEMFQLDAFNETLTQRDIDRYNQLIGGYTSEDGKVKIQGLNEYINLYNQTVKNKTERLPKLKPLYKQILSDRITASFIPEQFENDQDVLDSIFEFYTVIQNNIFQKNEDKSHTLQELLQNLSEYDLNAVFLRKDTSLTAISQKLFSDWSVIQKAVEKDFELNTPRKNKESEEKYQERKEKYLKSFNSFSIGYLNNCIAELKLEEPKKIESYFSLLGKNDNEDIFTNIDNQYKKINNLLNTSYPKDKNLAQQKRDVENIKAFLDSIKELQWFIKPLLGKGDESDKDNDFYGEFMPIWDMLNDNLTPLYNKVRNYMTRKPYSTEKFKLNFENSTLLDGWDVNKESDNTGVIFRKDGLYYLGIMNKKHNKILKEEFDVDGEFYEKVEYKLLPGANKMLPKVFFSKSRIGEFAPSKQLLENYENETHKKGDKFNLSHCHDLINFFKASIKKHEDWKNFDFNFSDTKTYQDLSGFYREVEQQGYKISFRNIPVSYIDQMVNEGKLYLFQIYNKDFSPYSKGTPNLHTLYWKMLFSPDNLKDVVYKLNGQAEVFFRESSIKKEDSVVHSANEAILNKNENNKKKESVFDYDIVKDKRFTVDKFQFHVPITMNFKAKGINNINQTVNQFIKENHNDIHVIGIDRGERHLLYLTLIDSQGKIKDQFSLNEIINEHKGIEYKTNYHNLLDKKEGDRDEARKNWQTIETIKELKEGYLSQVIHKIATLMVENNAIVVLEDLNFGFKRGRQKVEKSVYQKFEKMLIDKLNYLADKQKDADKPGGLLNAYQLTDKFGSFQKMGKQSGFLFYVPAWNTSKMDPVTGFVNLFDTRYENINKAKEFFRKFDAIRFNTAKNYFEFAFDYTKFTTKAEGTKTDWTVCTHGNRIENFRNPEQNNEWDSREFDLTKEIKDLFEKYGIGLDSNLQKSIENQTEKAFFYNDGKDKNNLQKGLLQLFRFALQMRNSKIKSDVDYLISPVANAKDAFYDSRNADNTLPKNADANGAYNIARKGLWAIEQIRKSEDLSKVKLAISNKEWLAFAQKNKF